MKKERINWRLTKDQMELFNEIKSIQDVRKQKTRYLNFITSIKFTFNLPDNKNITIDQEGIIHIL